MTLGIYVLGLLLVVIGVICVANGAPIIRLEQGWAEVIAGSVIVSGGCVTFAIAVLATRLDSLRVLLTATAPAAMLVAERGEDRTVDRDLSQDDTLFSPRRPDPILANDDAAPRPDPLRRWEPEPTTVAEPIRLEEQARHDDHARLLEPSRSDMSVSELPGDADAEREPPHQDEQRLVAEPVAALEAAPVLRPDWDNAGVQDAPQPRRTSRFMSTIMERADALRKRNPFERPAPAISDRQSAVQPVLVPMHDTMLSDAPARTSIDLSSGWPDLSQDGHRLQTGESEDRFEALAHPHEHEAHDHEAHGHDAHEHEAHSFDAHEGGAEPRDDDGLATHPDQDHPVDHGHDPEHEPRTYGEPDPHETEERVETGLSHPDLQHHEPLHGEAETNEADVAPHPLSPTIVGRYNAGSASYVMYSNGMIEVETDTGVHQFGSMQELKAFIEQQDVNRA
ncbi:hypothetical protein [Lichenihabitans psoromatis]|uniref:hypothetical protein n=1 Tax=Lichenihabitans psoromatis TaxID=2528642 RepID=UPI0010384BE1|nr:hypothetical protein [Lichenihabitans psoromatis]